MSRTPLPLALILALALVASGCGGQDDEPIAAATDDPTTTASVATTPTATDGPSASASTTATNAATPAPTSDPGCKEPRKDAVPDGTWEGPIALDVRGTSNSQGQGYGDSKGRGTMRLVVADGKVTGGTWKVTWKSVGTASSGGAKATVRVTGTITGTLSGPARKPVLPGDWRLRGKVIITEPVQSSGPIDETGKDSETMTVTDATCTSVTGTFLPSFNSKDTLATFAGTATWSGTKVA